MDRKNIELFLEKVDADLSAPADMVLYGAGAFMLLGEEGRTSLDLDVAGPYCQGDVTALRRACEKAGLPINPPPETLHEHIEWVGIERLCLPPPGPDDVVLWRGQRLTVRTVAPAALVASKLIRYDETDQADVRSLCFRLRISWDDVRAAAERLPMTFRRDPLVRENLENLQRDMQLWEDVHDRT
ncbi:MAG: hypothetical protein EPN23_08085 [Verrucomicrobia bacterium]|nr:MAG: hypothetical protein EPN23_08085 [Verrucomicrobiota bacterium]